MPAGIGGTGSSGQTLTIAQMYALARNAGLTAPRAVVAAAVGMAESSGRTAVESSNPDGGVNVGVWQLDTKGVGAGYTVSQLQNPATNAKAMAKGSSQGTNWSQWQTYATGAYTQFLAPAQAASGAESSGGPGWLSDALKGIEGVLSTGLAGAAAGVTGQLLQLPSAVTDFLTALEQPVQKIMWIVNPGNWARILAAVFGFFLLGAGLLTLMKAA